MNRDIPLSQLREMYATAQRAVNVDMSYFSGETGATGSTYSPALPRWLLVEVGAPGTGSGPPGDPNYWYEWTAVDPRPLYNLNETTFPYNQLVDDLFDLVPHAGTIERRTMPLIEINGASSVSAGTRVFAFLSDSNDALLFNASSSAPVAVATWDGATATEVSPGVSEIQCDETTGVTASLVSSGVVRIALDHTETTETYTDTTINYDGDSVVNYNDNTEVNYNDDSVENHNTNSIVNHNDDSVVNFNDNTEINLGDDVVVNIGGNTDINIGGNTTIDTDVNVVVNIGGPLTVNGPIFFPNATLVSWTANQTDLILGANNVRLRVTADAHYRRLNSLVGLPGQTVYLHNVGSYVILLTHEDAGSVAANRIATTTANDYWLAPTHCVALTYDSTDSRWRVSESSEERLGGLFTHADWGATQADFDPDREGQQQRVNPTVDEIELTGVAGGIAGLRYHFLNVNASNSFWLAHDDVTSSAANRFHLPNGEDVLVPPRAAFEIEYDGTSERWRLLGLPAVPTLTEKYIGYGSGANLLTGSADLIRASEAKVVQIAGDAAIPTHQLERYDDGVGSLSAGDICGQWVGAGTVDAIGDTPIGRARVVYQGDADTQTGDYIISVWFEGDEYDGIRIEDDGDLVIINAASVDQLLGTDDDGRVVNWDLGDGLRKKTTEYTLETNLPDGYIGFGSVDDTLTGEPDLVRVSPAYVRQRGISNEIIPTHLLSRERDDGTSDLDTNDVVAEWVGAGRVNGVSDTRLGTMRVVYVGSGTNADGHLILSNNKTGTRYDGIRIEDDGDVVIVNADDPNTGLGTDADGRVVNVARREILTANRDYYVRTDGSDSNTGLVDSSGGAFLTIQKAIDTAATLDCSTYNVTIHVGSGTFTGAVALKSCVGSGVFSLTGAGIASTTISTTSATSLTADGITTPWTVSGVKLQTTTTGNAITCQNNTILNLGAVAFGAVPTGYSHVFAGSNGTVNINSAYTISGGASIHLYASKGNINYSASFTVTVSGTPAFALAFAYSDRGSVMQVSGATYSGSATGTRYTSSINSVIYTNSGGASYFPGNAAGSTSSGGIYV